jgi:hypothetical protein
MQLESSAIAEIMIPDALTPGQFYDGMRADDVCVRAIKRLMLAVLEDAMRCYQSYAASRSSAHRRLFVESEGWLMDRRSDSAFSFVTVCETLGIDPGCLREGLRRWRMQQLDGLNPRRLARRSPVTRIGRISAPHKRRRRKASAAADGMDGGGLVAGVTADRHGNGLVAEGGAAAREMAGYDGELEGIDGAEAPTEARPSVGVGIQEAAVA